MSIPFYFIKSAILGALFLTSLSGWGESELELTSVINAAIENDPWLRQSAQMQDALLDESIAAS